MDGPVHRRNVGFKAVRTYRKLMAFCFWALLAIRAYPQEVSITQIQDVVQGDRGTFQIDLGPTLSAPGVLLRLQHNSPHGSAAFLDGSSEARIMQSGDVVVQGIVATDELGAMTLSAWLEGAPSPAAVVFFEVFPPGPEPRIFREGQDVTGTTQETVVGREMSLSVVLHPGVPIRSQSWIIESPGNYTGGFLHTPLQGGPQPVVLTGPSVHFYWTTPGERRKVSYTLKLANGDTRTASVFFDVDGPSAAQVDVEPVKVVIAPSATPNSSVLGLVGSGITFHAGYLLPEGLSKNFTWVQLILFDSLMVKNKGETMYCVPKAAPIAQQGSGLDTGYPYDTRNPTRDNPPLQLTPDADEFLRTFHARMYLLWTSGLANSIAVPLGFVDWHFSALARREDGQGNNWSIRYGDGGPNDRRRPFTPSPAYPQWSSLVPYSGVLSCN